MAYFLDQVGAPWRSSLIIMWCPGLVFVHQSVVLENHLLKLEECLRSWENSIIHYTHAQRGIQVQHGAVHALTGLASRGLMWCWRPLCCTE
jgi:hypothetical protein